MSLAFNDKLLQAFERFTKAIRVIAEPHALTHGGKVFKVYHRYFSEACLVRALTENIYAIWK